MSERQPWLEWPAERWVKYRADMVAACERLGEPWRSNIGDACVAMADFHLARLAKSTMPDADALAR